MKKLILIAVVVLLIFANLGADMYVKNMERTYSYEIRGRMTPENVEIKESWHSKNGFASHGKAVGMIFDKEKGKLFLVVHPRKVYLEFPTNLDRDKFLSQLPPQAAEVLASVKVSDVKVSRNGLKKKIANWNCEGTDFEMLIMVPGLGIMPKFKMTLWTTKDLSLDYKKYSAGANEFFGKFIMGILNIDETSKKELDKLNAIDGFQVGADVTVSIFGANIRAEGQTLEVAEKPAPAEVYSVPAGYKKLTLQEALGLQKN